MIIELFHPHKIRHLDRRQRVRKDVIKHQLQLNCCFIRHVMADTFWKTTGIQRFNRKSKKQISVVDLFTPLS